MDTGRAIPGDSASFRAMPGTNLRRGTASRLSCHFLPYAPSSGAVWALQLTPQRWLPVAFEIRATGFPGGAVADCGGATETGKAEAARCNYPGSMFLVNLKADQLSRFLSAADRACTCHQHQTALNQ
jgi:hypothetical protein